MVIHRIYAAAVAAAVLLCASCQKDAAETVLTFSTDEGTRGTIGTTALMNTEGNVMVLNGYLEKDGRGGSQVAAHVYNNNDAVFSSSKHLWTTGCFWKNQIYTNFWCHYPKTLRAGARGLSYPDDDVASSDDEAQKIAFMTYHSPADMNNADDIVFAYARKKYLNDSATSVRLKFRHALSAVRFTAGKIAPSYGITKLTLSGLIDGGYCTMTGQPTASGDNSDDGVLFSWSPLGPAATDKYVTVSAACLIAEGTAITGTDRLFFVIPQTLDGSNQTLTVEFLTEYGSTLTRSIALPSETYVAGRAYGYTLSFDGTFMQVEPDASSWNVKNGEKDFEMVK